jgi:hypothetical protein
VAQANTEAVLAHYRDLADRHAAELRMAAAHDAIWLVLTYYHTERRQI